MRDLPTEVPGYPFSLKPISVPAVSTRHRRIQTQLPSPATIAALQTLIDVEPRAMFAENAPCAWDRAEGSQVWDADGNMWIELSSGIFVANAGHGHPRILDAMRRTLDRSLVTSYLYPTAERASAISKLLSVAPGFECVLFYSAGTEAVESALKLARLRGRAASRDEILSFESCFHGKTLGSMLLAKREGLSGWFGWNDARVHHLPFPFAPGDRPATFAESIAAAERAGLKPERLAAVIVEPFQGWSSTLMPREYAEDLRRWTRENGILLIFDEVQSGFGRAGTLFAFQRLGVQPDIVTLGKGLSNGFPISAVMTTRELLDVDPITNSTNSGNPIGCAAIAATVDVFQEERLLERVPPLEAILDAKLRSLQRAFPKLVRWVSGQGLTYTLYCQDPVTGEPSGRIAGAVLQEAFRRGVLISRYASFPMVKISPPLVIAPEALEEALSVLHEAFDVVAGRS